MHESHVKAWRKLDWRVRSLSKSVPPVVIAIYANKAGHTTSSRRRLEAHVTKEQCLTCGEWFEDSELDAHLSEHLKDEPESEEQVEQLPLKSPLRQGSEFDRESGLSDSTKYSPALLDPNRNYYFVNPGYRGWLTEGYEWGNIYDEYAIPIARSRKRMLLESSDIPAQRTVLDVPPGRRDVAWKVLRANKAFAKGTRTWDEVVFEENDGTPVLSLKTERGTFRDGPPQIIDGSGNVLGTTTEKGRWGWVQSRPRMSLIFPPIGGDEVLVADQAKRPHAFSRPTDEFEIVDRLGRLLTEVRVYNPLDEFGKGQEKTKEERVRLSTWKTLMWSENIDRSQSTQFYALHVLDPSYDRRLLIGFAMLYLQCLHISAASD
jgi:hypothetical protein